jgi:hypothetical protein
LPQITLDLHEGKFNAPPVHDPGLGCSSLASCSANSFNMIWRVTSSGASARRFLKRAKFSQGINLSIALALDPAGAQHSQSPIEAAVGAVMAKYAMSGPRDIATDQMDEQSKPYHYTFIRASLF